MAENGFQIVLCKVFQRRENLMMAKGRAIDEVSWSMIWFSEIDQIWIFYDPSKSSDLHHFWSGGCLWSSWVLEWLDRVLRTILRPIKVSTFAPFQVRGGASGRVEFWGDWTWGAPSVENCDEGPEVTTDFDWCFALCPLIGDLHVNVASRGSHIIVQLYQ